MAAIAVTNAPGSNPSAGVLLAFTAATAGGDTFPVSGDTILVIKGTGASTITIVSANDSQGRNLTLTGNTGTGTVQFVGPLAALGWADTSGLATVTAGTPANVSFACIRVPAE